MTRWFRSGDGPTFHATKGEAPKALCGTKRPANGPRSKTLSTQPDDVDCCSVCLLYLDDPGLRERLLG